MMAALFDKLTLFLDGTPAFRYIRCDYRMEVWPSKGEELPIVVSTIGDGRYIISSGMLRYEMTGDARAYRYLLRVFFNMYGASIDYKFIRRGLRASCR